jgi:putative membrane protein
LQVFYPINKNLQTHNFKEKIMKRFLTFGFFTVFLGISLLGCTSNHQNTSNSVNLSRSAANENTAAVNASNTAAVVNANGNMETGAISSNSMSSNTLSATGGATPTDVNGFMMRAAEGGMAEIETGKMAAAKAQNPEVKQFGQQMIADHTRSNNELKTLAGKKNVTLPTDLDPMHKAMAQKLNGLSGAEFDKEYMRGQVEDHERTVALFQAQADNGTDAEAKALAAKTLPNLKMHLEMARKINDKLK